MNETIGNLSQTIVKLPNFFKSSVFNAPTRGSPYNYKKPPVMDTFNQVKKLNIPLRNRIFRLNDFLKIKSVPIDLNFNNNRRYLSPDSIRINKNFNSIIYGSSTFRKKGIDKNINLKNKNNIDNHLIEINNINSNTESEKQNEENSSVNEDEKNVTNKKIMNLDELKNFLETKTMNNDSKNIVHFPKITNLRYTKDELYKNAINKKINSLTTVKPEIKESIFHKNKNYTLEKDYYNYKKIMARNQGNTTVFHIMTNSNTNI